MILNELVIYLQMVIYFTNQSMDKFGAAAREFSDLFLGTGK